MIQEHKKRLLDEIAMAGGERRLSNMLDSERDIWNRQAVVLSYIREHGDVHKAAMQAGQSVGDVEVWTEENLLNFAARRTEAIAALGWKLHSTIVERVLDGEIKQATLIIAVLKALLPEMYGDNLSAEAPAKAWVSKLHEVYKDFDSRVEAAAEVRTQERLRTALQTGDEENQQGMGLLTMIDAHRAQGE